jgi:hypothetical protein
MVLDLLREGVRKPREPTHVHAHRKVLRSAKVLEICLSSGSAVTTFVEHLTNFAGAVALRARDSSTVNRLQHRVVDVFAEHWLDGFKVRPMSVARQLYAMRQPRREIGD